MQKWKDRSEASKRRHVERRLEYLAEHPEMAEKLRAKARERYRTDEAHRASIRARREHSRLADRLSHLWYGYRGNARTRGLEMQLSKAAFKGLVVRACHYCGIMGAPYNGIDRVDNALGYVEGNCVPCCSICNQWKRAMSAEAFIGHAKSIAERAK